MKDQFSKVYLPYFEPLPTQNERSDIYCQIITKIEGTLAGAMRSMGTLKFVHKEENIGME